MGDKGKRQAKRREVKARVLHQFKRRLRLPRLVRRKEWYAVDICSALNKLTSFFRTGHGKK